MRKRHLVAAAFAVAIALIPVLPDAQNHPILTIMQDEIARSIAGLRMKDEPPPYYISYAIEDVHTSRAVATLGSIVDEGAYHRRTLQVEVRVGDYDFDNSRFISFDRDAGLLGALASGFTSVSIDDDLNVLRRQIWLATDAAYKRAVSVLSKKKAAYQNRPAGDKIPDFSRETPVETLLPISAPAPSASWADNVRQISAVFASQPEIDASDVVFFESRETRYFVNSEGFKAVVPSQIASIRAVAETLAKDGMVLRDFYALVGRKPQDLPPVADLVNRARDLATSLIALRAAPPGDQYSGPVLVEGQASAEILIQMLAPLLTSRRPPDADDPRMSASAQSMVTPYLTRLGVRVLPEWMSVSDTPSLTQYENAPVPGSFAVDDEGVRAQDVKVVENGKLLTLLTSRTPQRGLLKSNGHARAGNPWPGVLQVSSAQRTPSDDLKKKYLELLKTQGKPAGYILRGVANAGALAPAAFQTNEVTPPSQPSPGGAPSALNLLRVVRVTPDGKEEPVRGLQVSGVGHNSFRDIVDASVERILYSTRAPGGNVVSVIVPDLIFEELEIQRSRSVMQRGAIAPTPLTIK
jgi:predicted Zn-dependent protease